MTAVLLSMSLFILAGAITPGPVNVIATSSGARFGFLPTLPHVLGATISFTLIVITMGKGLHQVLSDTPLLTELLKYPGSLFLLYIAFKVTCAPVSEAIDQQTQSVPGFITGALCQLFNPKAWLFSMSGISVFALSQPQPGFYINAYCVLSFILCFIGVGFWAAVGHLIKDHLQQPERQKLFNRLMGLLLAGTVVSILFN